MILRITSPTPMGRTAPSPLSRWIRRFASMASMEAGSKYSVHNLLVSVARASQRLDLDYLNDLEASILLIQFASIPEGPPDPLVRRAASFIISPSFS